MVSECFAVFLLLGIPTLQVTARAINISSTWFLPEEGFPVFYRYFKDRVTWNEADAICEFHHGDLVTVQSSSQRDAARAYLKELDIADNVWIGLMRPSTGKPFAWMTGEELLGDGYWLEPAAETQEPLCAAMDPATDFRWTGYRCSGPQISSFICELPVPDWAKKADGCMLTSLPSLSVTLIPEVGVVELISDCGMEGTRRITCRGSADREEMIRRLSCEESSSSSSSGSSSGGVTLSTAAGGRSSTDSAWLSTGVTRGWSASSYEQQEPQTRHRRDTRPSSPGTPQTLPHTAQPFTPTTAGDASITTPRAVTSLVDKHQQEAATTATTVDQPDTTTTTGGVPTEVIDVDIIVPVMVVGTHELLDAKLAKLFGTTQRTVSGGSTLRDTRTTPGLPDDIGQLKTRLSVATLEQDTEMMAVSGDQERIADSLDMKVPHQDTHVDGSYPWEGDHGANNGGLSGQYDSLNQAKAPTALVPLRASTRSDESLVPVSDSKAPTDESTSVVQTVSDTELNPAQLELLQEKKTPSEPETKLNSAQIEQEEVQDSILNTAEFEPVKDEKVPSKSDPVLSQAQMEPLQEEKIPDKPDTYFNAAPLKPVQQEDTPSEPDTELSKGQLEPMQGGNVPSQPDMELNAAQLKPLQQEKVSNEPDTELSRAQFEPVQEEEVLSETDTELNRAQFEPVQQWNAPNEPDTELNAAQFESLQEEKVPVPSGPDTELNRAQFEPVQVVKETFDLNQGQFEPTAEEKASSDTDTELNQAQSDPIQEVKEHHESRTGLNLAQSDPVQVEKASSDLDSESEPGKEVKAPFESSTGSNTAQIGILSSQATMSNQAQSEPVQEVKAPLETSTGLNLAQVEFGQELRVGSNEAPVLNQAQLEPVHEEKVPRDKYMTGLEAKSNLEHTVTSPSTTARHEEHPVAGEVAALIQNVGEVEEERGEDVEVPQRPNRGRLLAQPAHHSFYPYFLNRVLG